MTVMNKTTNEYAQVLDPEVYARIPKAVFAAIAVSYASSGGDHQDKAQAAVLREWRILNQNGIVPQAPPKGWGEKDPWQDEGE